MMSEPISIKAAQKSISRVLTRIELREEDEARDRVAKIEEAEFSRESDRWSFRG